MCIQMIIKDRSIQNLFLNKNEKKNKDKDNIHYEFLDLYSKWSKSRFFNEKNNNDLLVLYQSIMDTEKNHKNILNQLKMIQNNKKIDISEALNELNILDNDLKYLTFHLHFLKNNWIYQYKKYLNND